MDRPIDSWAVVSRRRMSRAMHRFWGHFRQFVNPAAPASHNYRRPEGFLGGFGQTAILEFSNV